MTRATITTSATTLAGSETSGARGVNKCVWKTASSAAFAAKIAAIPTRPAPPSHDVRRSEGYSASASAIGIVMLNTA